VRIDTSLNKLIGIYLKINNYFLYIEMQENQLIKRRRKKTVINILHEQKRYILSKMCTLELLFKKNIHHSNFNTVTPIV